ncbi:MAG: ABC-2 transporter permease [Intestinibacillus sp.]
MKAILRSDLLNFRQSAKSVLLLILFFCGMAVLSRNTSFFGILLVTLCLIVPFHLFSYDTAYGWDKLALSLPISRTSVIVSKYILCAGIMAILLVLSSAGIGLSRLQIPEGTVSDQIAAILASAAAALFLLAVLIPFVVKFGVTKGRYILMLIVWVPVMLVFLLKNSGMKKPFASVESYITDGNLLSITLVLLLASLLFYLLSLLISVIIYKRKEF